MQRRTLLPMLLLAPAALTAGPALARGLKAPAKVQPTFGETPDGRAAGVEKVKSAPIASNIRAGLPRYMHPGAAWRV